VEKNRLAEALKKHQILVEYNFYMPSGMDEQEAPPADAAVPEPPAEPTGAPATPETSPELSAPADVPPMEEPTPNESGEVELDITDLVNSTKDTKDKIEGTNELLNTLLSKFDEFESKMSSFDQILSRMDELEKDLDKRLPTPVEKLEMRAMDSFPYNVKLTDFWSEETEELDNQEKEYTLTPDEVKKDYNASNIKNSFDIKKPEDQDYNL